MAEPILVARVSNVDAREIQLDLFALPEITIPTSPLLGVWVLSELLAVLAEKERGTWARLHEAEPPLTAARLQVQAARAAGIGGLSAALSPWVESWALERHGTHFYSADHGPNAAAGIVCQAAHARLRLSDAAPAQWLKAALGQNLLCVSSELSLVAPTTAPARPADAQLVYLACLARDLELPLGQWVSANIIGHVWGVMDGGSPSATSRWTAMAARAEDLSEPQGFVTIKGGWVELKGTYDEVLKFIQSRPGCPAPDLMRDHMVSTVGDGGRARVGNHGTATAGADGVAEAGDYGVATTGTRGRSTVGRRGTATSGMKGVSIAGDQASAISGPMGQSTAGREGVAKTGKRGKAEAGVFGHVAAGAEGQVRVQLEDGSWVEARVGVELKPDVVYRFEVPGTRSLFPNEKPGWVERRESPDSVRARRT